MKFFSSFVFASVVAAFLMATPLLNAQVVPYKASGTHAQYNPLSGEYSGDGKGLHLGKHNITGQVFPVPSVYNPTAGPGEVFFAGTFTGFQTATAANGDTLNSTLSGSVTLTVGDDGLVSGIWTPEFEFMGSASGRFRNATGTLPGVAINPPFDRTSATWPFDWFVDGEFDMGKN